MPKWLRDIIDSWVLSRDQWKAVVELQNRVDSLEQAVAIVADSGVELAQLVSTVSQRVATLEAQINELKSSYVSPEAVAQVKAVRDHIEKLLPQTQASPKTPLPGSF